MLDSIVEWDEMEQQVETRSQDNSHGLVHPFRDQ
jgi:hypothetical protein